MRVEPRRLLPPTLAQRTDPLRLAGVVHRGGQADGRANAGRDHVGTAVLDSVEADAAVLACVLRQARRARLSIHPRVRPATTAVRLGGDFLSDETRFLVQVARIYDSPFTRRFSGQVSKRHTGENGNSRDDNT